MSKNCTPTSLRKHQEVPVPGPAGDSNGYIPMSPEPDLPALLRLRLPYNFTLASVASDGIPGGGLRYRVARTHTELVALDWAPLPEALPVNAHWTLEAEVSTPAEGATHTFQVIRLD